MREILARRLSQELDDPLTEAEVMDVVSEQGRFIASGEWGGAREAAIPKLGK